MKLMRIPGLVIALVLLAEVLAPVPARVEAAPSRERVRLSLLDACVTGEWKKREDTSRIADECKCAAQKAASQISPQEIAAYKGKLDRSGEAIWEAATRACFKSATASAKP
jgi:hypothetical protein